MTMQTCQLSFATSRRSCRFKCLNPQESDGGERPEPAPGRLVDRTARAAGGDRRRRGGAEGPGGGANGNLASCANRIVGEWI